MNSFLLIIFAVLMRCGSGLQIVALGDWGVDNQKQYDVAQAMSTWCGSHVCDFILNTGDNFYDHGVESADDPRFNTTWRWVYDLPNIDDRIWFNSVGNHDYGLVQDPELYQVDFGKTEPRWHLPWLWYDFQVVEGDTSIHFIIVDTTALLSRKHQPIEQLTWLNETLEASDADWKILVAHAPPYSAGGHAPGTLTMRTYLVPVCEAYGVDVFLSGDEHNLEHITETDDPSIDYVISGAGGRGLYEFSPAGEAILNDWGLTVNYFGYYHGFVYFDIAETKMRVDYVNDLNEIVYSFTRIR